MKLSTGLAFLAGLGVGAAMLAHQQASHAKAFAAYQSERIARDGKQDREPGHAAQLRLPQARN